MKKDKKKKIQVPPDRHPLHPERKLVTRRDFLSAGVLGFGGAVMLPTVLDMVLFERAARAGECPAGGAAPGMIPFLIFDCAGGASLPGNFVPTDREGKNGQLLSSYSTLGLSDPSAFVADYRFGTPMAAPLALNPDLVSKIFTVLTDPTMLPLAVQNCLRMGSIWHESLSDSGANMLSAISLVTAAGCNGSMFKNGLGMRSSPSAGNSDVASLNPAYKPMGINSVDSLASALSYGPAFTALPTKMKDALANALLKMSASQGGKLLSMRLGDQFTALANCGLIKNTSYTGQVSGVDARQDPIVAGIYKINSGSSASSADVVIATLVKNAIDGNSGPAVITIGGCDYHSGNRTDGDNKDTEIGTRIAQALQVAYAKGKKVAFQIFTDGGIYSQDGNRNWQGDSNGHSGTIFGIMDPAGPRSMVSYQLGQYTSGQSADRNHFLGTDPVRVAHTVFLNYLALCGAAQPVPISRQGQPASG